MNFTVYARFLVHVNTAASPQRSARDAPRLRDTLADCQHELDRQYGTAVGDIAF